MWLFRTFIGIIFFFSVFLGALGPSSIGDTDYFEANLTPKVNAIMQSQEIPGLSIAIVHRDKIVFAKGFGFANTEESIVATPQTVYGIGSVSKVVTATAFMQLVENGIINIHSPIEHYLPRFRMQPPRELPEGFENDEPFVSITPFNLLIHYSGLPRQAPVRPRDLIWTPQTLEELLHDVSSRSRLIYPPGFRYSYSNVGISVLGRIIEVVVNEAFESYLQRTLLQPLDMNTSSFSNQGFSREIESKLAQGYQSRNVPVERSPIRGIPAGNLHSSVLDMANFMTLYLNSGTYKNRRILKPETINKMFTVQNKSLREQDPEHVGPDQGLVWILNNADILGRPQVARHNGKVVGYSSILLLLPEEKIGVVVLTNIRNPAIKPKEIARAAIAVARQKY